MMRAQIREPPRLHAGTALADAIRVDLIGISLRRSSPDEAIALWRALVAGRWSIIDHFDSDGRRYLVARRNQPAPAARGLGVLSPRERDVLARAALGHTNKLIAYELGVAVATVASALASAAVKLGVATRAELIRLFHANAKGSS
jgi:DNA-binding NarL/FixJ family response regulator